MADRKQYTKGQQLGRCVYLGDAPDRLGASDVRMGVFRCRCGLEFISLLSKVKYGITTSCGCGISRIEKRQDPLIKQYRSEYGIWCHAKARCNTPGNNAYPNYGGRGIKIDPEWESSFASFIRDMGPRPSKNHSIDRFPDMNGDYTKSNCRWATPEQQNKNKRNNVFYTFGGQTLCLIDWARKLGISSSSLAHRIKSGMPLEYALTVRRMTKPFDASLGTQNVSLTLIQGPVSNLIYG